MLEYNILHDLQQHGGSMGYVDLLNFQQQNHKTAPTTTMMVLKHLLAQKYVSGKLEAYSAIHIEPGGVSALDQYEDKLNQMAQYRTDEVAEKKRERIFSIALTILGELLAFALGFLTHILLT